MEKGMKKVELKTDEEAVARYIEELQSKLPQVEVNVNNANDFRILLEEKEHCRKCKGLSVCLNDNRGYRTVYNAVEDTFSLKECRFKKEKRMQDNQISLIKTLYLPQSILRAKLEDFYTHTESRKKIYNEIVKFVNTYSAAEDKKGLYLYGPFSVGKTYTLACLANELAKKNVSCLLIYFPDLVVDLKNAIGTPRFEALINMLKSIEVLMLDDLGSENMTPWLRDDVIGPILNYRVLEKKPVFVSSNIAPNEIAQHFAIDQSPASILKAERLATRLNALATAVNMAEKKIMVNQSYDFTSGLLYLPDSVLEANISNYSVNTLNRKKIYDELVEFVKNYNQVKKNPGLYLYGAPSSGKTYTLACLANELTRNGIPYLFVYFPSLVVDLKNMRGTPKFTSLLNRLKEIDVLMLDDFGSENMTPWLRDEILSPIITYRALAGKPLFIASNISADQLIAYFAIDKFASGQQKAPRLVSKLQELVKPIRIE